MDLTFKSDNCLYCRVKMVQIIKMGTFYGEFDEEVIRPIPIYDKICVNPLCPLRININKVRTWRLATRELINIAGAVKEK